MANVQNLQEKVQKATEKVEKCKGTIVRHEKALAKKVATLEKLVGKVSLENLETIKWNKENNKGSEYYWEVCDIESKQSDIKGANKKLRDAEIVLGNWQEKLDVEVEKERFLEGNAPKVIKDFLEAWKVKAYEWHIKRYNDYQTFKKFLLEEEKEALAECSQMTRREQEAFLKEKELDWRSINSRKANFAGGTVMYMDTIRKESERIAWLEKSLEEEKKAKMLDLINRINDIVGTITDASFLRVSEKGNLDGYIIGEKGKAKVETIGAGGWNIQCFHYRTLVNKIK